MAIIIDSDLQYECAWSPCLRPVGVGTFEKEKFDTWWERTKHLIGHLHPLIAEQWIYRHWTQSPYCYVPLQNLGWQQEKWNTQAIYKDIFVRPSFGPNRRRSWPEFRFRAKFFSPPAISIRSDCQAMRSFKPSARKLADSRVSFTAACMSCVTGPVRPRNFS